MRLAKGMGSTKVLCCQGCHRKHYQTRESADLASKLAKRYRSTITCTVEVANDKDDSEMVSHSLSLTAEMIDGAPVWECFNSAAAADGGTCTKQFNSLKQPSASFSYHLQDCITSHSLKQSELLSRLGIAFKDRYTIDTVLPPNYWRDLVAQLVEVRPSSVPDGDKEIFARKEMDKNGILGVFEGRLITETTARSRVWWKQGDKLAEAVEPGYYIDGNEEVMTWRISP